MMESRSRIDLGSSPCPAVDKKVSRRSPKNTLMNLNLAISFKVCEKLIKTPELSAPITAVTMAKTSTRILEGPEASSEAFPAL